MIDKEVLESTCRKAIATWGERAQFEQAMEDLFKLGIALNHYLKKRPGSLNELLDEVADVWIMINQLRVSLGEDLVDDAIDRKFAKFYRKLQEAKGSMTGPRGFHVSNNQEGETEK